MKKKWLIGGGVFLAVALAAGIFFYLRNNNTVLVISPAGEDVTPVITQSPAPFDLTTWKDEAGFSFEYPKDLKVNKHEEDPDNYAHVELTSGTHPGKIIVWVSDRPKKVTDLESWVKLPAYKGATVLDTMLGGQSAKKILVSSDSAGMITVGTISDDLLFSVEGTLTDKEYWTRVHDAITNSFAFTSGDTAAAAPAQGGTGEDIDEEEVLQ